MTMQIRHAGKSHPVTFIARLRRRTCLNADESALIDLKSEVASPALRQQRFIKEQSGHTLLPIVVRSAGQLQTVIICIDK